MQVMKSPLSFRHSLRQLAGRGVIESELDDGALYILLHALKSVSWALLFRDLSDFSMVHDSKILQWKESLRKAFDSWLQHTGRLYSDRSLSTANPVDMPVYWIGTPFAYMGERNVSDKGLK